MRERVYQCARPRETVFRAAHVPWFTRPSCLTAKLSNTSAGSSLYFLCPIPLFHFCFFFLSLSLSLSFHLHRRSTITRLRSMLGANNALVRSHFHNSHAFRLFRASCASRPTSPESRQLRSAAASAAPSGNSWVTRCRVIFTDYLSQETRVEILATVDNPWRFRWYEIMYTYRVLLSIST